MDAVLKWNDGMAFIGEAGGHSVHMDAKAPFGRDSGLTPKELVAMGLGGCTAMDVIALLKKFKQIPESFSVTVEVTPSHGQQPIVFEEAVIRFSVKGSVLPETLLDAVRRSQTQYCGVSAMLVKSFPIRYLVELNGQEIGAGEASFNPGED